jgi:hypothetical protein
MTTPRLTWGNGVELGWKEIGFIAWAIFSIGAGWYRFNALEHSLQVVSDSNFLQSQTVNVLGWRTGALETRIDTCCPVARTIVPLMPRDLLPPEIGRR